MKANKNIIYFILGLVLIMVFYQYFVPFDTKVKNTTLSDITSQIKDGKVEKIQVEGNKIVADLKDGTKLQTFKESSANLTDYGIDLNSVAVTIDDPNRGALWLNLLSIFLPVILIGVFLFLMLKSSQGANMRAMSFGKSTARLFRGVKKVTFKDVAGAKESKEELIEIVQFLKTPEKFKALGAEVPKGVLLAGPPGTGKTLLAKAVAGEAGVPFFSISASEFVEMFVGVGAARVRDLFLKAKKNAPSILFIDELDAVGRQRGTGLGGSHDEREQTLNQILVEMDGFETDEKVIVIASTNRPDVLDPALLRPGRFDRRVMMGLPDKNDRLEILKIHTQNKKIKKNLNLDHIAAVTIGFSGADLRNLTNEAAICAARSNKTTIDNIDFNHAIERIALGPEKKSRVITEKERKITAYHEAGHAIVSHFLENTDDVHKISIISRGMAMGYTWTRPMEDRFLQSEDKFKDEICALLAGRVTEEMIFKSISTGASNDLREATKIAKSMVTIYGMSEKIGLVSLGDRDEMVFLGRELAEHKIHSEKVANLVDSEISKIISEAKKRSILILKKKIKELKKVAEALLKRETLEGTEFAKLVS